jgi:excisionase family DNA binding protein
MWAGGWLTTEEAAKLTGLHVETIREYCRAGAFITKKIGGKRGVWTIEPTSLLRFIGDKDHPKHKPRTWQGARERRACYRELRRQERPPGE